MRLFVGTLLAAAITIPSQLFFTANGTGAVRRPLSSKLGDVVSVKDFGAPCNGSGDDFAPTVLAIAALPSAGGVVDARSCDGMTGGSTLIIAKAGVKLLLPSGAISMGSNQIVVSVSIHNVAIEGVANYGASLSNFATAGTKLVYTGSSAAIAVGASSADTYGFRLQDVAIDMTGAGSAAIAVQLNRTIGYDLIRPAIGLIGTASTQIGIDLEGSGNYTGGKIDHANIAGGGAGESAIFYGNNANANMVVHAHISMGGAGTGVCHNFDGGGVSTDGNRIAGGDCENCLTALKYDFASHNHTDLRAETCTNVVVASANSSNNQSFTGGTSSMTATDSGTNNAFTDDGWTLLGRASWKMKNTTDTGSLVVLQAGSAAAQLIDLQLANFGENWRIQHSSDNNFRITRNSTSVARFRLESANTDIQAEGAGFVGVNNAANSGTGGFQVFSGGASPSTILLVDSSGNVKASGAKSKGTCTLNAGSPSTCTATVLSGAGCVCSNQSTQANPVKCSVTTTTLTVTGPNAANDVIGYLCL